MAGATKKQTTWQDDVSKLIGDLKGMAGFENKTEAPQEAAIVGGGAAGTFRAQQMANAKAANLARASGAPAPAPASLQTLAPPDTRATLRMPTTGNAGGGGTASGGLITQGAQPNTSVIESGRTPFADPNTLRNATPRSGAGIGSVLSGGAVLNPVVAGLAATAAMTGTMGDATVKKEGDINDIIANPAKYAARAESIKGPLVSPQELASLPAEFNSKEPTTAPVTPSVSRSAPEQRSPLEQQMSAPKAIPVAEPVEADRAAMLFAKTHGSAFDPKSSMDKKKMAAITSLMGQEGSEALTPNQFALKIYRTTKK